MPDIARAGRALAFLLPYIYRRSLDAFRVYRPLSPIPARRRLNAMKKVVKIIETALHLPVRRREEELRRAMKEFSRSLTLIVDLDQLKHNVVSVISGIVHIEKLMIFLLDLDLDRFRLVEGGTLEQRSDDKLFFSTDGRMIQWFTLNETSLRVSENPEIFSFFDPGEQQLITDAGIDLIFPLLAMNRLTGLVCLGPKSSVEKLGEDELELLSALLGQAALAFENAYLYEQQRTRLRKMYRADRLATLGQLAAGAAHEIRNPLTSIRSTIQYLHKNLRESGQGELLGELIGEVDRINGIIEGLLSFSRPTRPETKALDLKLLIGQVITLVETTATKHGIALQMDYLTDRLELKADPSLLKQVFLNVVMNAFEAMDNGGEMKIVVHTLGRTNKLTGEPEDFFHITFADTGPGIPPGEIDRIFDPFYTTKKEGTGLGLSISYGIIQQHGGDIEVDSVTEARNAEKHGTTVTIRLPAGK